VYLIYFKDGGGFSIANMNSEISPMQNRRFNDAVRHHLINIQAKEAMATKGSPNSHSNDANIYQPDDVAAFVDLQNLHFFLKESCRVAATQIHIPNLLRDFAAIHNMQLRDLVIVTGIHGYQQDAHRHEAMRSRVRWLEHCGAKVTTLPLTYRRNRETGETYAVEKGIDVRIGSEILRAVHGGLRRALVITQDKDISQAIKVASEMAEDRGSSFHAYSMELHGMDWENNGKCGTHGIAFTEKLPIDVAFVRRYERSLVSETA